eukprot:jgi/Psemu1/59873/gm1.59873_g
MMQCVIPSCLAGGFTNTNGWLLLKHSSSSSSTLKPRRQSEWCCKCCKDFNHKGNIDE